MDLITTLQELRAAVNSIPLSKRDTVLFPRLRTLIQRFDVLQLDHLEFAPVGIVAELGQKARKAIPIAEFLAKYHTYDERLENGTEKNQNLLFKKEAVTKHAEALFVLDREVYSALAPVLTHQTYWFLQRESGQRLAIQFHNCAVSDETVVWKYMPMESFERTVKGKGIWFSSLQKLCDWSEQTPGLPDTHEGEIPPVVKNIADDYTMFLIGGDRETQEFEAKYPFYKDHPCIDDLIKQGSDKQRNFASSWSIKPTESNVMWHHYAGGGKGIAVKTTVQRLRSASWRIPFFLSGIAEGAAMTGVLLRPIKYLNFDDTDRLASIEELNVAFLKRSEFADEREIRLLCTTSQPLNIPGFVLHCDLKELVEEIVVGPKADQRAVHELLHSSSLRGVSMRNSKLGPRKNNE